MLARCQLDRKSEVPLFRQLHAAIEMAIIEGELPDGVSLPSVRVLARELEIAPVTVIQAYKGLQQGGWIQSVPKRGFFVSVPLTQPADNEHRLRVQELIDQALVLAFRSGIDEREFSRLAVERARRFRSDTRVVAVFGVRYASLEARVSATATALADLNVDVIGIAFEDVETMDKDGRDRLLGRVDVFLVAVDQIEPAVRLLGSHSTRILPMTRVPIRQVEAFVLSQPDSARFGILAESEAYANRMIAVLRRIRPMANVADIAIVDDPARAEEVIRGTDAILVGSLASHHVDPRIFLDSRVVAFTSVPDMTTLDKLRNRIVESRSPFEADSWREKT